jgi:ABC-type transport system involved in multi-copper enzyme maturation permease subunit
VSDLSETRNTGDAVLGAAAPAARASLPWARWWSQTRAVVRLELRKILRRPVWLLLLAIAPLFILFLRMIVPGGVRDTADVAGATQFFAGNYQGLIQPIVIFLGCVAIFGNLIRREMLDRSLHYYFLSPIRREVLVVGKYLTGLIVSCVLFGLMTVAAFGLNYLPHDSTAVSHFLFHGPGLAHLGAYLLVTVLACVGYGAVFLFFGSFFKSPALPALAVFGWERINFLLPPLLKKISVIYYLQSLCPVPVSEGPLATLTDKPAPWVAILGLLVLAVVLVAISAWRIRTMEISYDEA